MNWALKFIFLYFYFFLKLQLNVSRLRDWNQTRHESVVEESTLKMSFKAPLANRLQKKKNSRPRKSFCFNASRWNGLKSAHNRISESHVGFRPASTVQKRRNKRFGFAFILTPSSIGSADENFEKFLWIPAKCVRNKI